MPQKTLTSFELEKRTCTRFFKKLLFTYQNIKKKKVREEKCYKKCKILLSKKNVCVISLYLLINFFYLFNELRRGTSKKLHILYEGNFLFKGINIEWLL